MPKRSSPNESKAIVGQSQMAGLCRLKVVNAYPVQGDSWARKAAQATKTSSQAHLEWQAEISTLAIQKCQLLKLGHGTRNSPIREVLAPSHIWVFTWPIKKYLSKHLKVFHNNSKHSIFLLWHLWKQLNYFL